MNATNYRARIGWILIGLVALCAPNTAPAQELPVRISVKQGVDREERARVQLERILGEYDVGCWIFTTDVVIDEEAIPHSHPVLTLHTRYLVDDDRDAEDDGLNDDLSQLSTFLHEQFHWLEEERREATGAAIAEFREHFPTVPVGYPEGGSDEYSTYLHLIVSDLEFQAMASLVGEATARRLLAARGHYTWVYERVLEDPLVGAVNERHGFVVPECGPGA